MTDIPDRERGYSVERDTGTVHERYQDHAPRAMRTSALGVTNVLDGREAVLCLVCFPVPKAKRGKAETALPLPDYALNPPRLSHAESVVIESEPE